MMSLVCVLTFSCGSQLPRAAFQLLARMTQGPLERDSGQTDTDHRRSRGRPVDSRTCSCLAQGHTHACS